MTTPFLSPTVKWMPERRRLSQAGSLYLAVFITVIIGFVTSVITTRILGPERYGDMKFIVNVFQFLAIISTLGIFTTGSQMIARLDDGDKTKQKVVGALVITALLISGMFVLISIVFSILEPRIFGNNLGVYFIVLSPLVAVSVFEPCIEGIFQGANRIHQLSLFRILPGILYLGSIVVINFLYPLTLTIVLWIQLFTGVLVTAIILYILHPEISDFRYFQKMIWWENRHYGWHVYIGVLSGVATTYLSTFMISYYLDNTNVGFFSLAVTLTMPLVQLSSVVGTTYFKDFAHSDILPTKVTVVTVVVAMIALLVFLLFIGPLVTLVYTNKFNQVISLASIIAFGSVLHGLGDYFNRFLGAHKRGKDLRNGAITVGVVNILGYYFLVKFFGAHGAAITRLLSGMVYCGMMVYFYRVYRQERSSMVQLPPTVEVEPVSPDIPYT